jgi:1,2-diacylglycerol 3-alpha-glucosyltransferase
MKNWVAIPNFVDTDLFRPERERGIAFRQEHGIPADALVFGCAAAVKKHHKRIDYLIREFSKIAKDNSHKRAQTTNNQQPRTKNQEPEPQNPEPNFQPSPFTPHPYLLIAGAREEETDELLQLAENIGKGRIKVLLNLPREEMPAFYNAADVFVLTSLFEMMPIAVLEALASGLPLLTNNHPVLNWMRGPGGEAIDMSKDGELTAFLGKITPDWIQEKGRLARQHALDNFSKHAVIEQYIEYYKAVLATKAE